MAGVERFSTVIKNSEFLGCAAPVSDMAVALEWLSQLRLERADASHVAWAYRIGPQYRFSDDGEPSGTAGAPIGRALEASGLDFVSVAVVRYYGGVNLGAGGLVRAYGGTASQTLRLAVRLEVHARVALLVAVSFEQMNALYRLLQMYDVLRREEQFTADGLELRADFLETDVMRFTRAVRDATRGAGRISEARFSPISALTQHVNNDP